VSISFHWFSDVVAGAIIGTVIGVVVAAGVEASESELAGRTLKLALDRHAPLSRGRS